MGSQSHVNGKCDRPSAAREPEIARTPRSLRLSRLRLRALVESRMRGGTPNPSSIPTT
jgi:hypothetical protein